MLLLTSTSINFFFPQIIKKHLKKQHLSVFKNDQLNFTISDIRITASKPSNSLVIKAGNDVLIFSYNTIN